MLTAEFVSFPSLQGTSLLLEGWRILGHKGELVVLELIVLGSIHPLEFQFQVLKFCGSTRLCQKQMPRLAPLITNID